jgi:hypothetical protein
MAGTFNPYGALVELSRISPATLPLEAFGIRALASRTTANESDSNRPRDVSTLR